MPAGRARFTGLAPPRTLRKRKSCGTRGVCAKHAAAPAARSSRLDPALPAGSRSTARVRVAAPMAGSLLWEAGMSELSVERFMTHSPHTIGHDQPLRAAHEKMRLYGIRHLPVLQAGKLVGMLSQRDLHFIETLSDVDPETVPVSDAMSTDTYAVGPRSTLRKVAAEMADHRYGSAVVVDKDRVIGILTTVDGMRALSTLLGERRTDQRE